MNIKIYTDDNTRENYFKRRINVQYYELQNIDKLKKVFEKINKLKSRLEYISEVLKKDKSAQEILDEI